MGNTEEEEEKKKKRGKKEIQCTLGLFLQGEGCTESRGLIIFNPRGVSLPFHVEMMDWERVAFFFLVGRGVPVV